jgi:hypothetical protein
MLGNTLHTYPITNLGEFYSVTWRIMFDKALKSASLGVAVALSTVGFAQAKGQGIEGEKESAGRTVPADKLDPSETSLTDQSFSRAVPSGPLKGATIGDPDAPVPWGYSPNGSTLLLAGGLAGAALGINLGVSLFVTRNILSKGEKGGLTELLGGVGLGAAIGAGAVHTIYAPPAAVITFDTTVTDVIDSQPAHAERIGKFTRYPYFRQQVLVAELPVPLNVNIKDTPLKEGESIKASVALDREGKVIGWMAVPSSEQK